MSGPWDEYAAENGPWQEYAALPIVSAGAKATINKPADKTDWLERATMGYTDPMIAAGQLVAKGLQAVGFKPEFMAERLKLPAKREADYQASRGENAGTFDPARMIGNVINPINVAITSKIPIGGSLGGRVLGGVGAGAASGVLNPVVNDGNFIEEKAKQAGIGGAVGGIIPVAATGVRKVISPNASINPNLKLLKSEGVNPTIGQTLGGGWNKAEEQAMSLPIVGNMIARARGNALGQFNTAAINRATSPIGVAAEGKGFEAIGRASDSLSNVYENALNGIGNTRLDHAFTNVSNAARSEVSQLPPLFQNRFNRIFESSGNRLVSPTGEISAKNAKAVMSEIGAEIRKFGSASDVNTAHYVEQLSNVQDALRGVLVRQNPAYAQAVKSADRGWANLVRVENAANRAVNNEGVFTPGQLNLAIRGTDSSARKNATAHGDALMQDLGNAGQAVLGNKVPDSGTAGRGLLAWLISGGADYMNPVATVGGLLGSGALYTSPIQKLFTGAVSARPSYAPAIGGAIEKGSPLLIPAFGASVPYLVNQ